MKKNGAKKGAFLGISASALIAVILLVGTTLAYLVSQSTEKKNVFVPGVVDCDVSEVFDGTSKSSIKIQNTGNTDAYIRVTFATYWQDADGNVLADTFRMPEFDLGEDWVLAADGYYYYKYPVAPGDYTGDMLADGATITLQTKDGNNQVIEVISEAVQAKPDDAVVDAWDSDGRGVAAVKDDESLVLYARVYDNYANGTEYESRYRAIKGSATDKATNNAYHSGIINDGVVSSSADSIVTITAGTNVADTVLSFYMVNIVEVDCVEMYVTESTASNISTIQLYCGYNENPDNYQNYVPDTLVKSDSVDANGMYVYSFEFDRTVECQFVVFKVTLTANAASFAVSEIKINGYMASRDLALRGQYRGADGTSSYVAEYTSADTYYDKLNTTGDDITKWNEYHTGLLNDTSRSSSKYDNKPFEKVLVKNNDANATSVKIQFKLARPSLINGVDVWTGPLPIGTETNSGNNFGVRTVSGNSAISCINVYVSETESELGQLLGTVADPTSDKEYLDTYTISGKALYGEYVTIEVVTTDDTADFGFNEIFIWSDGLPMLSE